MSVAPSAGRGDFEIDRYIKILLGAAAGAAFLTAFEIRRPIVSAGPVAFTSSEVAAIFFLAVLLLVGLIKRGQAVRPAPAFRRQALDIPVLLFLASNFFAVGFSADVPSAFKFSLRMTLAAMVYFGISRLPAKVASHLAVAAGVAAAMVAVTFVGLLENHVSAVEWPYWLSPWQESIVTFGTFFNLRVSSTLPFPTVLAMYLELAVPLALVLGLVMMQRQDISSSRRRCLQAVLVAGLAAAMAVLVYTYTRSALVAAPASLLAGAGLAAMYGLGRRVALYFGLGVALLALVLGATTIFSNKMSNRLGISEQAKLYGASYQIVEFPQSVMPGQRYSARLHVKNTSEIDWKHDGSDQITMTYRWLEYPGKTSYEIEHLVTYLPRTVAPGEELDLDVPFLIPADPGRYVMAIELVKGHVGWFSDDATVPPATVPLEISADGSRTFVIDSEKESFVQAKPILTTPSRSVLWRAAVNMWKEHPLFGVGPGQYRKVYPEYIEGVQADERLETHNIYLEALANTGIFGLAAMLYLLAAAGWFQLRMVRNRALGSDTRMFALGLLVALIAYVTHGLLDFFLWQTGIAFLFFIQLGLTSWLSHRETLFGGHNTE